MSSKTSTFRFVLAVISGLAAPLLCGCFLHTDVPLQPAAPSATRDSTDKGTAHAPMPLSPANNTAEGVQPAGTRGLMLHGGWYRIPLTAEESSAGIYDQALAKQEKPIAATAGFRYRHAGLERWMARPATERSGLPELLSDRDPNVAVTAAVALARQGDAQAAPRLIAAIEDETVPLPARCAAIEALGQLPGNNQTAALQKLIDRHGQFRPGASTGYQADLHAELLRALARHVEAADDPRYVEAVQVPSAQVRIEVLRAWAAGTRGAMPAEVADLRSDESPQVRAAALAALAARNLPAARDYLTTALHDVDLSVRLAAVRGLGRLDDAQARATLAELLKDRSELIRAEAVMAIAARGSRAIVLGAAGDLSWRVRLKVAEALAGYGDSDGAAAARRMLDDASAEVERQVVRSMGAWSGDIAGPVLLEALGKDAVSVRKLAAEQLAARWPAAGRFPFDAMPVRRAEALRDLQTRYHRDFGGPQATIAAAGSTQPPAAVDDEQVEKLLAASDFQALADLGPGVVAALERLAMDRKQTLPEPVYRDVLPRHSTVFVAVDRIRSGSVDQRRQAAEDLDAAAAKQPLSRLAVARLSDLLTNETDSVVWLSGLDALHDNASEPAVRMARLALEHASGAVRRRACEFLAAHPDPAHEVFLAPLINDPEQVVAVAAIRALGAAGQIHDMQLLKKLFASPNEEIQLEAAFALARLHDRSGEEAIERLSYSDDLHTRCHVAQALGALGEARLTGILIRLLDDPKATVSHAALASLPKIVGHDLSQPGDGPTVPTTEQIARWKKWFAAQGGR